MQSIRVVKCECISAYQDARYGPGKRAANRCKPGSEGQYHRCTVCGKEHGLSARKAGAA